MPFWDFIRDIFGTRNSKEPTNNRIFDHQNDVFTNSIRQNDENNIRLFHGNGNHFNVFGEPLEIARYFESQIDYIFKNFMFGSNNGDYPETMDTFLFNSQNNLRNKMLKPGYNFNPPTVKEDSDLDGKVTSNNFSYIWDKHNKSNSEEFGSFPYMTEKSIMKEYEYRPNSIIKQKQIIRDHEGNEVTIISEQVGEKMHTVVIKKDKNGVETKTENFGNIDKSELTDKKDLLLKNEPNFDDINLTMFFWRNFFHPNPKL